jgi:tRNA G18 (ribose-2'-O)-methylase SpoU
VIEPIGAPDDPRLDPYRNVGDPHWLRSHGLFVAEGRLVVSRMLDAGGFEVSSILVTPAAQSALAAQLTGAAAPVYVCDQTLLNVITGFNFHRGCLAIARRPQPPPLDSFADSARLLALEGVGNPDNVGGLFRVAAAFGVNGVLLDTRSGDPLYRKAIRTSMGAVFGTRWRRLESWPADLDWFRARGFRIAALTPRQDATPIDAYSVHPQSRVMVVVGAEGPGLSDAVLDRADDRVRIPIAPGVDSLNVTVAAGIVWGWLGRWGRWGR